jgi:two-component system alkaline phosphatase synthesis response regulator PhoP
MKKRILMIEDGRGLVLAVGDRLTALGYEFEAAYDGPSGLAKARAGAWDLLVVDLMLPLLDGEGIVRQLRSEGATVPILILTAKDQMADRVAGLKYGADDYMTKPFSFEELLARVEAHLRRGPSTTSAAGRWLDTTRPDFLFGEFTLHYKNGQLFRDGKPVVLSHQEFRLLSLFAEHPREVMGTDRILSEAWGYEAVVTSRTVYVHVAWLRKKLRTPDRGDGHIKTVRGIGYVFEP